MGLLGLAGLTSLENGSRSVTARGGEPNIDPTAPMRARVPDFQPTATNVIVIYLVGGPSHIDTFDHKPALTELDGQAVPDSIRSAVEATRFANVFHGADDKLMASPYGFRQYGEMGMWVSELHPHLARHVDRMSFIHSLQAESNNHAPASYQWHTGEVRSGKASFGSWVTYGLGSENDNLPGYVLLFDAGPLGGSANYTNGFLPAAFQPTRFKDHGPPLFDLVPPDELAAGQQRTFELIGRLDRIHRAQRAAATDLDARIAAYELAYRMQHAALEVGDLTGEPAYVRSSYAIDAPEGRLASFGRKCLMARRLVERGVRFVQLYDMPDKDGWDAHGDLVANHTPRARWTDQPAAALLDDLAQRGLLDSTLVVWISEFGRTPMMQGDRGRQHNAAGFTCWLAGGGVVPGQRIGATDEIGLMAIERPIAFRDLHASILTALGIDFEALSFPVAGRDERLTGVAGMAHPIDGLLRTS
ncbi:MAG: DUF1501 domain-containing protein [Planctomycetales bacterium]|nr:DUF1501 domain-containing protein [Planctomycetales bacterium]